MSLFWVGICIGLGVGVCWGGIVGVWVLTWFANSVRLSWW